MDAGLLALLKERLGESAMFWVGAAMTALGVLYRPLQLFFLWARGRRQEQRDKLQNEREQIQSQHRRELDEAQRHIAGTYQQLVTGLGNELKAEREQRRVDIAELRSAIANALQEAASARRLHENCQQEVKGLQETCEELRGELDAARARIRALEGH